MAPAQVVDDVDGSSPPQMSDPTTTINPALLTYIIDSVDMTNQEHEEDEAQRLINEGDSP